MREVILQSTSSEIWTRKQGFRIVPLISTLAEFRPGVVMFHYHGIMSQGLGWILIAVRFSQPL